MGKKTTTFSGFPKQAMTFLKQLERNNDREWFERNRQRYEDFIVGPAFELIAALAPRLSKISPRFPAVPKKVGGSLGRIHRDMRFARNRVPYNTHVALHFRHEASTSRNTLPAMGVHLGPDGVRIGAGLWTPDAAAIRAIRERIVGDPAAWKRASRGKRLHPRLELAGAQLLRVPSGYPSDHVFAEDLRRRQFVVSAEHEAALAHSPELVGEVEAAFRAAGPFLRFLTEAVGAEF